MRHNCAVIRRWGKAGVAKVRGLGTKMHKLGRKLTARRQIRRANKSLRRQLKVRFLLQPLLPATQTFYTASKRHWERQRPSKAPLSSLIIRRFTTLCQNVHTQTVLLPLNRRNVAWLP